MTPPPTLYDRTLAELVLHARDVGAGGLTRSQLSESLGVSRLSVSGVCERLLDDQRAEFAPGPAETAGELTATLSGIMYARRHGLLPDEPDPPAETPAEAIPPETLALEILSELVGDAGPWEHGAPVTLSIEVGHARLRPAAEGCVTLVPDHAAFLHHLATTARPAPTGHLDPAALGTWSPPNA